ncbi:hypothetical protein OG548_18450 [Streptomyces sp. NBC_01356]|uniref:hypothetical protein n=1 Tax=Streptomyces sp. NBC_01356 TaxID=2903836 RepID=UPI002E3601A7|nr:hypothetical protein [Streptomyces sp. NBC_01356]
MTDPAARRPVRMCTRCQRTTEDPVLIHEVPAATGPGFNVYACPECAAYYPPLMNVPELLEAAPRPSRMTIRVYRVTAEGAAIDDRGEVRTWTGSRVDPTPQTAALPPCTCLRCRTTR